MPAALLGRRGYGLALMICVWLNACPVLRGQEASNPSPAEQFVLRTIEAGKEADLKDFSPIAERRVLGHEAGWILIPLVVGAITGIIK